MAQKVTGYRYFFDLQPIDVLHSNNVGTRENHRKLSTRHRQKSFLSLSFLQEGRSQAARCSSYLLTGMEISNTAPLSPL